MCKGICSKIKEKYKRFRLVRKGVGSFSCHNCEIYFPISLFNTMYEDEKDIIETVIKYKGKDKLEKLRCNNKICFCCGRKFSSRLMGSFVSDKRDELELLGIVNRI